MITRLDAHEDQRGWDVMQQAHGAVAWDVGTNIGQALRVLAKGFDHVLGFEPCTESWEIASAEAPPNCEVLNVAAGRFDGYVDLEVTEYSIQTGQLVSGLAHLPCWGDRRGTRRVPCRSLDSLLEHNPAPDFLKIDVEGAEVEVLLGATRLIREVQPQIIVEVHSEANGPLVRDLLSGYELEELRHGDYMTYGGNMWRSHYWLTGGGLHGRT